MGRGGRSKNKKKERRDGKGLLECKDNINKKGGKGKRKRVEIKNMRNLH